MINSAEPDLIVAWKRSFTSTLKLSSGNFLTISLKKRAGKTTLPVFSMFKAAFSSAIEITVSIEISELLPVIVKPSSERSSLIPDKISNAALDEIAR